MKIFIAGARSLTSLDVYAQAKMHSIFEKKHDIIVGDCYGIDAAVQKFFAGLQYDRVTVFASNGKARNNLGNWEIHSVLVPDGLRGFEYYRQKDLAMVNEADFGFMIWDGESRGTLNNIVQLIKQGKQVLVHIPSRDETYIIKDSNGIADMLERGGQKAKAIYKKIEPPSQESNFTQMSLI